MQAWIGFDLDGTLVRDSDFSGELVVGEPIPHMVDLAKLYQRLGFKVKVFTARAENPLSCKAIQSWAEEQGLGRSIEVTNRKDYAMLHYYDDRACGVLDANSGLVCPTCFARLHQQFLTTEQYSAALKLLQSVLAS